MKRLVFYGACIALSFAGALASADRHHWWKLAFDVLCIIVLVGACGTTMREARAQHHRDMLKAFDLGRSSIVREQIEMARRGKR